MATMLELHGRALHLPHIRRYHATRQKRSASYDTARPAFGVLTKKWSLPAYLLDPDAPTFDLKTASRNGWIQFLNWNKALPVVSEIGEDSHVVSVATGAGASAQHRILERFLSRNRRVRNLAVVSVPVLHFRGLVYARRKNPAGIIVPLRSPVARFRMGAANSADFVLQRLKAALAHRRGVAQPQAGNL